MDIEGHSPTAGPLPGFIACTCGVSTNQTWEKHVADSIRQTVIRKTAIDTCVNCGDLVITTDGENWAHYRGPGSRLNRCQHTAPYGVDATPAHGGAYVRSGAS